MKRDSTTEVFFALLRSGLWEQEVSLAPYEPVNLDAVYQLAEEQSVIGLVAAAFDHIDRKVETLKVRPFLVWVIAQEQRNKAMNDFVNWLIARLREEAVEAVIVKGQGLAHCYARPKWRACGDIDLFLTPENYEKARVVLLPISSSSGKEIIYEKHLDMLIGGFAVEIHGTMNTSVSDRIDITQSAIQERMFREKRFRTWQNGGVDVLLPEPDDDVIFVFVHIVKHFYKGGIGMRQICDWCRLLWTYKDTFDRELLLVRLKRMDIMDEWKGLAALAVDYLGIPSDAMPFYDASAKWSSKARKILRIVLQKGNFGHKEDRSYYQKRSYIAIKVISLWRWIKDYFKLFAIFPQNSWRSFWKIVKGGIVVAAKGE